MFTLLDLLGGLFVLGILLASFMFLFPFRGVNNRNDRWYAESKFTLIDADHDTTSPISLQNLPKGSKVSTYKDSPLALLPDGSVIASTPTDPNKRFANPKQYRDYVADQRAIPFD